MEKLKEFISLGTSMLIYMLSDLFERIELLFLQKLFYIVSILVLLLGVIRLLGSKNNKDSKSSKVIDTLLQTQKANKILELADDPEQRTTKVLVTFTTIKKGGKKVMKFFKTLSVVQLVSFAITLVLLLIGVLSAFIPELAFVGEHFETFLLTVGIASSPGILSRGRELGEVIKGDKLKKVIKALRQEIRGYENRLADLETRYTDVIRLAADVEELGGRLTPDQETTHYTYLAQKRAIELKLQDLRAELAEKTEPKKDTEEDLGDEEIL